MTDQRAPTQRPVETATDNAVVTLDGTMLFSCWDNGERWNGAVCPRFTAVVARAVVAVESALAEQDPQRERLQLSWGGDAILIDDPSYDDEPEYRAERVEPGDDGRYPLGASAWVWQEVDLTDLFS